jgi:prepilin-type N-terminal cleavage/methylation domain-containing protein
MMTNISTVRLGGRGQAGFTLIEMMLTMGLTLIIMGSTLAAMNDAIRASESAQLMTSMNAGIRTAMDIMVRDMLQIGQGLPSGRMIDLPNGTSIGLMRLPGAPATTPVTSSPLIRYMPRKWDSSLTTPAWVAAQELTAVIPGGGIGPTLNGTATDVITFVQADGAFLSTISDYNVNLTVLEPGKMVVDPSVDITNGGADDLHKGDLIMLMKNASTGMSTALVQITRVPLLTDTGTTAQTVYFDAADSLNLNQAGTAACVLAPPSGSCGTLTAHIALAPGKTTGIGEALVAGTPFVPSTATRIRLISYYIDSVTDPARPRLVRRVNNGTSPGDEMTYNNNSGTVVAFDVENLQVTYDLVDDVSLIGVTGAQMNDADLSAAAGGACLPNPCSPNQIRKINVTLTGRSRVPMRTTRQYFRNTLTTQVSLRSMAFIDKYNDPPVPR